jgi:hypothetical protein
MLYCIPGFDIYKRTATGCCKFEIITCRRDHILLQCTVRVKMGWHFKTLIRVIILRKVKKR